MDTELIRAVIVDVLDEVNTFDVDRTLSIDDIADRIIEKIEDQ